MNEGVEGLVGMAYRLASRFSRSNGVRAQDRDDAAQAAALALVRAGRGYSPERGGSLKAYAGAWVRAELKSWWREKSRRSREEPCDTLDARPDQQREDCPVVGVILASIGRVEAAVLRLTYGIGTFERRTSEIASELGMTRQAVHQARRRGLAAALSVARLVESC